VEVEVEALAVDRFAADFDVWAVPVPRNLFLRR
jgi:hypothetical protein